MQTLALFRQATRRSWFEKHDLRATCARNGNRISLDKKQINCKYSLYLSLSFSLTHRGSLTNAYGHVPVKVPYKGTVQPSAVEGVIGIVATKTGRDLSAMLALLRRILISPTSVVTRHSFLHPRPPQQSTFPFGGERNSDGASFSLARRPRREGPHRFSTWKKLVSSDWSLERARKNIYRYNRAVRAASHLLGEYAAGWRIKLTLRRRSPRNEKTIHVDYIGRRGRVSTFPTSKTPRECKSSQTARAVL